MILATRQHYIPTNGHYPVIIDFGFSYINDMKDGPLWPSMAHTCVGFMSDRFDWVADPKLFLVTVSGEIIMEFLYFLLKCVLVLTLDDPEEAIALRLLDTSFKLLSITVSPLMKMKCSLFSCCRK